MCVNKRTILNRVSPWKRGQFDKYSISVPCGNCPSCRRVKQHDWLVRSYYEITCNTYKSVFFVTLDFDDAHLPRYNNIPCFDTEVIKAFFKRLRYYTGSFRYLYSTDYGAALQRPHYHVMFLFHNSIEKVKFYNFVKQSWPQGHHSSVEELNSGKSFWNCVQYVCKYTVKDITFPNSISYPELNMPMRYRPRSQASTNFGYSALEQGKITWDMLKNNLPVSIPVGKNGKLYKFSIPRYYEFKITQYSVYYPKFRRSEWFKNELGRELEKIRHNCHYIYLLENLISHLRVDIHNHECFKVWQSYYPKSPYLNSTWSYMLSDCLSNGEDFLEFLQLSPYLERTKNFKLKTAYGKYIDSRYREDWLDHLIFNANYEFYNQVLHLFKLYCNQVDYSQYLVQTYSDIQESRKRLLNKIKNNPSLSRYLKRIGFDYQGYFNVNVTEFIDNFESYYAKTKLPSVVKRHLSQSVNFNNYRFKCYLKNQSYV